MRALIWLWRVLVFFVLFAFALNNKHSVDLNWFLGYQWRAPMVFIVLAAFAVGCVTGVLAMVPSWWRHRRNARHRQLLMPDAASAKAPTHMPEAGDHQTAASELPAELPFPPDMPAPRKPSK